MVASGWLSGLAVSAQVIHSLERSREGQSLHRAVRDGSSAGGPGMRAAGLPLAGQCWGRAGCLSLWHVSRDRVSGSMRPTGARGVRPPVALCPPTAPQGHSQVCRRPWPQGLSQAKKVGSLPPRSRICQVCVDTVHVPTASWPGSPEFCFLLNRVHLIWVPWCRVL